MKRRIQLYLQRLIGNLFEGVFLSYLSAPHGLELDELRQYQPGDDLRSVDWKASIKTGRLHVRMKLVDKRVTIFFLIDRSRSEKFGSFGLTKEDTLLDVLFVLVRAATETGNELGFVTFTDRVEDYIMPKAGEKEAQKNVKKILSEIPSGTGTDLDRVFRFLIEKATSPSLIFIMSDFLAPYNYEQSFKILSYLHEVIPVIISDRIETRLPEKRGFVTLRDMETGMVSSLEPFTALEESLPYLSLFKKLNVDHLTFFTEEDEESHIRKISEFFDRRIRRGGRRRR